MMTPGIMMGMYRISRTRFLPRNFRLTKIAAASPAMFCRNVLPKPYTKVLTVEIQKVVSVRISR